MLSIALLLIGQAAAAPPVVKEIAKACDLMASFRADHECTAAQIASLEAEQRAFTAGLHASPSTRRATQSNLKTVKETEARICGAAKVLRLTSGQAVEVSTKPDVCASDVATSPDLVRVRLKSGKDAGTIGCVSRDDLRDPVPF